MGILAGLGERESRAREMEEMKKSDEGAGWEVFVANGWGSVIAEAALAVAGIGFERVEVDPEKESEGRERWFRANALRQLPTVIVPGGEVLTESAAIVLRVAEVAPGSGLAPGVDAPERVRFLRWLAFLVGAVYPTFTFGDDPTRWVKTGSQELRESTDAARKRLMGQLEEAAAEGGPWFLGERFSAIDIYVTAMSHWRPRQAWYAESCPRLAAIAAGAKKHPALGEVWARNFPG